METLGAKEDVFYKKKKQKRKEINCD